jgi:high-affinity iron transporter
VTLVIRRMFASAFAVLFLGMATMAAAQSDDASPAQLIAHMLDYVGVDYPQFVKDGKVLDKAEYQEQLEFASRVSELIGKLPDNPARPVLQAQAQTLKTRIEAKAAGEEVTRIASDLRRRVIDAYQLVVAPRRAPDLRAAAAVYEVRCAACHGAQGRGDGPAAKGMDPAPSDFHDAARMGSRSVYGLYSTITLGVQGTAMPAFATLSEEERWALAFHVAGLAIDPARAQRGEAQWKEERAARALFPGLREVATMTAAEIREKYGEDAAAVLAWLTRHPGELDAARSSPIVSSKHLIEESLAAYRRGERDAAQRLAVTAYLEGFELVEASLDAVDADLRVAIENEMMRLRSLMRSGAPVPEVEAQVARVGESLDRAEERLGGTALSPTAAAVSAFVILAREGLEAILVLAAIIAFLVKAQRRDALRYVHAGWIAALALGFATWFVAAYAVAISGAGREVTEGVTALIATAILVYVGIWLHGKSYASAWKAFIEQRLAGALSHGTVWALAGLSFLAVYREAFETVLFYQALWVQAGDGGHGSILVGLLLAAAGLVLTAWLIFHYGVRLPIGLFFTASSTLLALLAVIFAGQGIAALQEAGAIGATLIEFPRVPALGIFPTAQSLGAQALVFAALLTGFAWTRISNRRRAATKPR